GRGALGWRRRGRGAGAWGALAGGGGERRRDGLLCGRGADGAGWEHVGSDRVDIDVDGGFRFCGRSDSIVKIEGQRVSLPELEEQLRRLAWIADAAVVVLDESPAKLGAAVVPSSAGAAVLAELGAFRFGPPVRL